VSAVLLSVIRFYQRWISHYTPPMCRFHPTCSNYAIDAIRLWGPVRGSCMGAGRILRCHPFHPGGFDPVPLPPGALPQKEA
jgi:putative membrane protein insertion efficiency factor